MAYSDSFPATRPVFQADFANGGRVDPRITFSRSDTPPTYAAPSAVHYWSNEKHLSSENLVLQSSSYNTTWSELRLDLTGSQTDPSGGTGAWKLAQQSGQTNAGEIYQYVNATAARHVLSFYAKAGTNRNFIQLTEALGNGTAKYSYINLSTGAAATVDPSHSFTVTAVGSTGWYRISVPLTPNLARSAYIKFKPIESDASVTVTDNQGFIYLWGVQLEQLDANGPTPINQTTTQIHRAYAPTLKSVATAGQPRFEYDPASDGQSAGTSLGIVIEGQVANVMAYSRNGFNASNSFQYTLQNGVTATENAAVGPSGSLDATLLSEDSTTGGHQLQTTETVTSAAHTVSVYVKPVGVPSFGIRISSGAVYGSVFTFADESFTNYGTAPEASRIESVGGGWYRLSISQTVTAGSSLIRFNLFDSGGSASYTGTGYNGILLWGFQCEANSFPSSWVDTGTSGSTATRAAESLSMTDSSLFDNGGGALVVENKQPNATQNNAVVSITDGGSSNYVRIRGNFSNFRGEVYNNAAIQADLFGGTNDTNYHKQCITYGSNNVSFYVDGNKKGSTDTAAVIPELNTIHIGWAPVTGNGNQHIRRVVVYGNQISETEAAALTS